MAELQPRVTLQLTCVGSQHHREACRGMLEAPNLMTLYAGLDLRRDYTNAVDPNAIAFTWHDKIIGYVPVDQQARVRPLLDDRRRPVVWELLKTSFSPDRKTLRWHSYEVTFE